MAATYNVFEKQRWGQDMCVLSTMWQWKSNYFAESFTLRKLCFDRKMKVKKILLLGLFPNLNAL